MEYMVGELVGRPGAGKKARQTLVGRLLGHGHGSRAEKRRLEKYEPGRPVLDDFTAEYGNNGNRKCKPMLLYTTIRMWVHCKLVPTGGSS